MGHTKAIGRRGRVLTRAHDRAQRRWHAMIDAGVQFDPDANATRLTIEAERLVDRIMAPEVPSLDVLLSSMRRIGYTAFDITPEGLVPVESEKLAEYWNRGA